MNTDNLRKLAFETNDGVLRGPAFDAADGIDRLRAEIERLTKERDEARAQVASAYKAAAKYLQSAADDWRSTNNELAARKIEDEISGVLELTSEDNKAALEAYGREKVREVLAKAGKVETTAGPWALDTSTGSEILVKGGCSVIEGEDARYLLRLIAADTSTPAPDAVARLVEAAMHLLSEYDAPNPVDDAVSKLRTALAQKDAGYISEGL